METPDLLELGLNTPRTGSAAAARLGSPSPRIQHYDGDVPPSLSPLDAFAAHSRRLAKELEETRKAGERRMSRLPPQLVTESLTKHQASRPYCFRTLSGNPVPPIPQRLQDSAGTSPEVTSPPDRPASAYPWIGAVLKSDGSHEDQAEATQQKPQSTKVPSPHSRSAHGLEVLRTHSPKPLEEEESSSILGGAVVTKPRVAMGRHTTTSSHPDIKFDLAPPNAAFARGKPYHESSDDDYTSSNAGSTFSKTRKLSSSSGMSHPLSPASPNMQYHQRSISNHSNSSLPGLSNKSSHLNFSRPMSPASMTNPNDGSPVRQPSRGSHRSHPSQSLEYPRTPTSFDDSRSQKSDGFVSGQAASYTHAKFTLPRGRMADRTSAVFLGLSAPHFEWQEPMFPRTPPLSARQDSGLPELPPTLSPRPSRDAGLERRPDHAGLSFDFDRERARVAEEAAGPSLSPNIGTAERPFDSSPSRLPTSYVHTVIPKPAIAPLTPQKLSKDLDALPNMPPAPKEAKDEVSRSSRSNSTIRPTTTRGGSNHQALSADEHVAKSIELHQHGDLKESTYHIRIAAKQDHPTGMLLYALACRHGWGMRPNQVEGVQWLRKAVDGALLEVADDEDPDSSRPKADVNEKKTHRAQFALSIYELGVSHLNGWGVEQDKALALRCFEIAGNWGDPDALTEAGFCYAEGIGCKKNLKKAAKFYRRAEAQGVSMIGNSWIYKEKYNEPVPPESAGRESRAGGKISGSKSESSSKNRSLFGRKKTAVAA